MRSRLVQTRSFDGERASRGRRRALRVLHWVALWTAFGWQGLALPAEPADPLAVAQATGSGPLATSIEVETLQIRKGSDGQESRRWKPAVRLHAGEEVHYTVR